MTIFKAAARMLLKPGPEVIKAGHPALRTQALAVRPEDLTSTKFTNIVRDMGLVLKSPINPVLGLAASQIGHPIRLIAYQITDSQLIREHRLPGPVEPTFVVNPEMTVQDRLPPAQWAADYEFCESIPGYSGLVRRASQVHLTGLDLDGKPVRLTARGILARIIQHEMDHLDGVLFVDKMEPQSFRHDSYVDKFELIRK
ncbi:peptide deformylase [Entophlyctis helioformis]|nr:peptide deformylase [Entophlyctis helioformis]